MHHLVLMVNVEQRDYGYGGHYVYLGGSLIGTRPYDGSEPLEIANEVAGALAVLVSDHLKWSSEDK